ncbi:bifunctional pantoate--beta-alanine ligase/(d)CMP kinase [Myxacorys almedinensis A]|uniref:Bifunctional pantoate ligase/cytidylate kinase n=1 Tax=Myxacorys almedinensis A TaxID=2690445 RepID=A0A8J7YYM5_9CYAN|nr:bifunctional pantoate--beta-alanine ligase/(d)CMP kinase [Myxacorys almedinensis A]
MRLFSTVAGLRCYLDLSWGKQPRSSDSPSNPMPIPALEIGFVPTMGALHTGHLSLIERARRENKLVVVSIFVNPLQFAPGEDFSRYPRQLERDRSLCEGAGVDVLFTPTPEEMGVTASDQTHIQPPQALVSGLCGRSRPGHFEGVATIVTKLLNLVQPDRSYFGQKDAQQVAIIRRLVQDLKLPVEIIACPIIREANGLALSSRNQYLSDEEKIQATALYQGLANAQNLFRTGERSSATLVQAVKLELANVPVIHPEYIELVDPMTLKPLETVTDEGLLALAARIGSTRLIDNCVLRGSYGVAPNANRQPMIAIDGPAGAGKSTVARKVAEVLGLFYLDTGAMYRALTWFILKSGVDLGDEPTVAELASQCQIDFVNTPSPSVFVNGEDVTQAIRTPEVTARVSAIAAQGAVRAVLVRQQQHYGQRGGIVIDGRDIGTHVFPDAEVKIFLTASIAERARRRQVDLKNLGQSDVTLGDLERAIAERDRQDSTRAISPLRKADDAIEIKSDNLTIEEVLGAIVTLYQAKTASLLV